MTENPLTPDKVHAQFMTGIATPTGLGRRERRALRGVQKGAIKNFSPVSEVHQLESISGLLEADDLSLCTTELVDYRQAQTWTEFLLETYRLLRTIGIPDRSLRAHYAHQAEYDIPEGETMSLGM